MTASAHRAGQVVGERYQLLQAIGSGGMGFVWRARHIVDGQIVALKLLHADASDSEQAYERFLREARALQALRSPYIVRLFDSGIDSGVPFMAMELLAGETLGDRLERLTRLPGAELRHFMLQVAEAIATAHETGIVHRDLKPDNIFLVSSETGFTAKLLDFGVAKSRGMGVPLRTLTQTGVAIGTPHYMSPEQIDGMEADARSDLWSLGVIAFECLLGARPFDGPSIPRLCFAICEAPLPVPSSLRPVPAGFDEWFHRAVAREPAERFQSARELAAELERVLGGGGRTEATSMVTTREEMLTLLAAGIDDEPRLMQHAGDEYEAIRGRVVALVDEISRSFAAVTVERGRCYAFGSPAPALDAAVALEQRMAGERWPRDVAVAVRVALGEGRSAIGDTGVDSAGLARVRTLCAAAHGGQILVSQSAAARIARDVTSGELRLADLGEHEIEDTRRERVFQAVAPGLTARFAPLDTGRRAPNNLPSEVTEFIGREDEVRALAERVAEHRLVTVRGPGGIGKTRLALRVAAERSANVRDGTFLVPLAAVRDARLVLPAIASVLGVPEDAARALADVLRDYLATREMLLALDNFEQVADAAPEVLAIVRQAPALRVLVTSRTALGVTGECVYDVSPFTLPAVDAPAAELAANPAVQLFLDRARSAGAGLVPRAETLATVAAIVRRVDGLPLAIELAAARLREYKPEEILTQLAAGSAIVAAGGRERSERHRSLAEVVRWSYDLLPESDRILFRRLAVFVGGFTRALGESVAGGDGRPVATLEAGLTALEANSLLRRETHDRLERYAMLETIREFALGELERSDEADAVRLRHAHAIRGLVSASAPLLRREGSVEARDRLSHEDGNIRAALELCLERRDGELGVQIAGNVWRYWQSAGRLQEGRRWLVELRACPGITLATRARGLDALGGIAYWQADYETASNRYREALAIFRDLGDRLGVGEMLFALSTCATWSGESARGETLAREALDVFEELGAREQIGMVRMAQGFARWMQRDITGARTLWQSSIEIAREVGDHVEAAHKTLALAAMTYAEGDVTAAIRQGIGAMEELLERHNVALTVMAIDFLAAMIVTERADAAARLSGAATQLRRTMGGGMRPEASGLPNVAEVAASRLGAEGFRREFDQGRKLDLFSAIDVARQLSTLSGNTHATASHGDSQHG